MKKLLVTAATLALASGSAYASKARILALGEEVEDHFFIEDSRSIFTNAAYANNYADTVMLEWGGNGSNGILDTDTSPKAMGGFLRKAGNYTYGAYLGNESNVSSFLRIISSNNTGTQFLPTSDNQLDFFFAGEGSSVKWGTNLLYSSSENKRAAGAGNSEDSALSMRFGALGTNWEGFANVSLKSEAEDKQQTNAPKFEGKLGFQVGGSYSMNDYKFHGSFKKFDWEQTASGTKTDGGFTRIDVGAGKIMKVNNTDMVFTRLQYTKLDIELDYASGKAELNRSALPLVVGYEGMATSWLKLRGSISHNLIGTVEQQNLATAGGGVALKVGAISNYGGDATTNNKKESTIANSTTVNAGATLVFGNLEIDGFIGATEIGRNATNAATASRKDGVLETDNLLTRVGMTYKF